MRRISLDNTRILCGGSIKYFRFILLGAILCLPLLSACDGSKLSLDRAGRPTTVISVLAVDPSGGLFADALADDLAGRGFQLYDSQKTTRLANRSGAQEFDLVQPNGLTILAQANIDALIVAHSRSGADGLPQNATARVISTQNGMLLAGVNWQNGLGIRSRPTTDQTMRKDLYEAASEIAGELTKQISPELMNGRQHILSTANLLDDLPGSAVQTKGLAAVVARPPS